MSYKSGFSRYLWYVSNNGSTLEKGLLEELKSLSSLSDCSKALGFHCYCGCEAACFQGDDGDFKLDY